MERTGDTDTQRPSRGRVLFERRAVLRFIGERGLPTEEIERELAPFVGVRTLARLLDVSPSWIRELRRRGVLQGEHLRAPENAP